MNRISSRGAISLSLAIGIIVSSGVAASLIVSGSAGAAGPKPSDKCTTITGKLPTLKLSGCTSDVSRTDPAEPRTTETRGTGTLTQTSATTATVKWKAPFEGGGTVQIINITVTPVGGPGQPTDETETKACPAGTQELVVTGTVATGSDDATATTSSEACLTSTGSYTEEPGSPSTTNEPGPPNS